MRAHRHFPGNEQAVQCVGNCSSDCGGLHDTWFFCHPSVPVVSVMLSQGQEQNYKEAAALPDDGGPGQALCFSPRPEVCSDLARTRPDEFWESCCLLPSPGTGAGVLQGELQSCGWFKHLPASIMHFQPALRTLVHPISQEYLRDTLQKWIHM